MKKLTFSLLLFLSLAHAETPVPVETDPHASFLENLAVPKPATASHLPAPTITDKEWRGVYCGVTQDDQVIFRHDSDWTLFWDKAMRPYSTHFETMPPIDF